MIFGTILHGDKVIEFVNDIVNVVDSGEFEYVAESVVETMFETVNVIAKGGEGI